MNTTTTTTSNSDTKHCAHCQTEIHRTTQTPAIWKTVKYCSASCRLAVRPQHPSTPRSGRCLHCATVIPFRQKFCSEDCQYWALAEKMDSRTDKSSADGCWIWTGPVTQQGYGIIGSTTDGTTVLAHRASLERHMGRRLPPGMIAAHRCDVPGCLAPDHLYASTQLANMRDAAAKGRTARGPRPRKLTDLQAYRIRCGYAAGGLSMQMLAEEYGVDLKTIHRVVRCATYRPKVTAPEATLVA